MKSTSVKIGDRVRFLNTTGGGIVRKVAPSGIAHVEDEDGFEVPTLISELVVVTDGATLVPKPSLTLPSKSKEVPTYTPPPPSPERQRPQGGAGEKLDVHLAYLPEDPEKVGAGAYEVYVVNESNYDLHLFYLTSPHPSAPYTLRRSLTIAYDSTEYIEAFAPSELSERARTRLQIIAFKGEVQEPFKPKPVYDIEVRLEGGRFFKVNAFAPNDFFDDGAIIFDLITQDAPRLPLKIDPLEVRKELLSKRANDLAPSRKKNPEKKPTTSSPLVVDLHIQELVDSTTGMGNKEMLDLQLSKVEEVMKLHSKEKGRKIIFIHGKGEGVLREAVLNLLKRKYPRCSVQDASFREYGYGASQVTIH